MSTTTITRYVRYSAGGHPSFGILDGENIRELRGSLFDKAEPTGKTLRLSDVKLLTPCEPVNVVAVGQNYKSHLGDRPARPYPGLFWKPAACLIAAEDEIVFPEGAANVHYEADSASIVLVFGTIKSLRGR